MLQAMLIKIAPTLAVAIILSFGQVLFKIGANKISGYSGAQDFIFRSLNLYVVSGGILYVMVSLLWLTILSERNLSDVYPIIATSFIFTPLLAYFVLSENLTIPHLIGAALITAGVAVIASA